MPASGFGRAAARAALAVPVGLALLLSALAGDASATGEPSCDSSSMYFAAHADDALLFEEARRC